MSAMTTIGPVPAASLKLALMHEHLIHTVGATTGNPEERMDDESLVAGELAAFRQAGGRTVVDLTTTGIGPAPAALARLARTTGLNIIAGTGYYIEDRLSAAVLEKDEDALASAMCRDLMDGFPGTSVRAGIIGELGCGTIGGSDITPFESRVLRAAARAQRATGAAISVHTQIDDGPQGFHVLDILEAAGAHLTRVVLAHCDARIDLPYCRALMARGALVEYSAIGRARHTGSLHDGTPVPGTAARVAAVAQLVGEGYTEQLILSHDVCDRAHLLHYGGGGFAHLVTRIVPLLTAAGVSTRAIDIMLVETPARLLDMGHR